MAKASVMAATIQRGRFGDCFDCLDRFDLGRVDVVDWLRLDRFEHQLGSNDLLDDLVF
jgi:hypothetical protein